MMRFRKHESINKGLSFSFVWQVKTLHRAIEYIQMLQEMLAKADEQLGSTELCLMNADADSLNKENEINQRWLPLATVSNFAYLHMPAPILFFPLNILSF